MPSKSSQSIIVIGAGPVGLCCALAMAEDGYEVTLLDSGKRGAGWASGGMLGAVYETLGRDDVAESLTRLAFESLTLWDGVAKRAGIQLDRDSLFLARNADEVATLEALASSPRAALRKADSCSDIQAKAAWVCAADATLNPRDTLLKLKRSCRDAGVAFVLGDACSVETGAITLADGKTLQANIIILATGQSGSALADNVPELNHLTPVKGQMLAVAGGGALRLAQTIRAGRIYLLPRGSQIVIGATSNPKDSDPNSLDKMAHQALHQEATALWPALAGRPIVESWSGFRPMTPDSLPMFGPTCAQGVYLATGTYRNGWLLAPAIAQALVDMVGANAKTLGDLQPFSPQRFPI
jgi:glycine oxidase